jgi:glycosyl transferase family 25
MIVLINLESADVRRQHMTSQLTALGVPFERVGIDLRSCDRSHILRCAGTVAPDVVFDMTRLSGAEVGCWLSHMSAWRRLFANPACVAGTVVEDDVVLGKDFAEAVAALEAHESFDLVLLGTSSRNVSRRKHIEVARFRVHEPVGAVYNTWGYVIRRSYVEKLLSNPRLVLDVPIDHVLGGRRALLKPVLGVVQPAVVREDPELGVRSQIEPHTRRIDRWQVVERARRRILASRFSEIYYSIYRLL